MTQPDEVTINCDGAARGNPGPAAIGAVVLDVHGDRIAEVSERIGETTNNVAEYRALIAGLRVATSLGARRVHVRADSNLVVQQVQGAWRVREPHLLPLRDEARALLAGFEEFDIRHVPREENAEADALANAAFDAG